MKKLILFVILSFVPLSCFAQHIPESIIKVGIVQNARSFNFSCEGAYHLSLNDSEEKINIKPLDDYLVKGEGNSIIIEGTAYDSPVELVAEDSSNRLRINGRRYRNTVLITCKQGKLTVINELSIEEYIYGILPCEVDPKWAEESLKAQAVVSRTYALKNLKRHEGAGFDLCSQTHCQVYGGMESEDPRTNKAVDETKGEVLTFEGQLAQALYHASCAGFTENAQTAWGWSTPAPKYLKGRRDKFCSDSPHQSWKSEISADTIRTKLANAGYDVGKISKIQLSGKTGSGRAAKIKITHTLGNLLIPASKFRMIVDTWLIKSTYFTKISRSSKNTFEFKGHGWGHGVGMCQWGAKVMAEKGHDYKNILEYYYPGTEVQKWEE